VFRDLPLDPKDASPQPRAMRHTKSNSSEFNTREYRPLYLLERNRKTRDLEEETLPALPASGSGSPNLASTEDEWQSAVESVGLDSGVEDPLAEKDPLTPKATSFPANVMDGPQKDVVAEAHEAHEKKDLGPAFKEMAPKARSRPASPLAASPAFDDLKMRDHALRSRDTSPSGSSSALQKVALGATAGGLAAITLRDRSPSPLGPRDDPEEFMGGNLDDETLELTAKSTPASVSPPSERPALVRAPSSSLKKGGKKGKKGSKSKSVDFTGEAPKELSAEEIKKIEEQDAADAVGDWFVDEPVIEKNVVEDKPEPVVVEEKEPDPNLLRRDSKGKGKKKAKPKKKGSISDPSTSPPPTPSESVPSTPFETAFEDQGDSLPNIPLEDELSTSAQLENVPSSSGYVSGSSKQYVPTFVDNEDDWAKNRAESVFTDDATLIGEQPAGFEKNAKEELRRKVLDNTAPANNDDLNIMRVELNTPYAGKEADDIDTLVSPFTETRDSQFFTPIEEKTETEISTPIIEKVEVMPKGKKGKKPKKGKKGSVQVESLTLAEEPVLEKKEKATVESERGILRPAFEDTPNLEPSLSTMEDRSLTNKAQDITPELETNTAVVTEEKPIVEGTPVPETLEPEQTPIPVSPEAKRDTTDAPISNTLKPEEILMPDSPELKRDVQETSSASTAVPAPSIVKSIFSTFGWGKKRPTTPESAPPVTKGVEEKAESTAQKPQIPESIVPSTIPVQEKPKSPVQQSTQPRDLSEPLALAGIDSEIPQLNELPLATPIETTESKVEHIDSLPQLDFGPASSALENDKELPRGVLPEADTEPIVEEPSSSKKKKGKKDKKAKRESISALPEVDTKPEQEVADLPKDIEIQETKPLDEPQPSAELPLSVPETEQTPTVADIAPATPVEDEQPKATKKKGKKGKKSRQGSVQIETELPTPVETVLGTPALETLPELPSIAPEESRELSVNEPTAIETVMSTPNLETLPELPPIALEESRELSVDKAVIVETVPSTPALETLPELPPVALEESQELSVDAPAAVETVLSTPNLETLPELPPIAFEESRELSIDEPAAAVETVLSTPNLETLPELPPVALEESRELSVDESVTVETVPGTPNLETLPELPPVAIEESRELGLDESVTVETVLATPALETLPELPPVALEESRELSVDAPVAVETVLSTPNLETLPELPPVALEESRELSIDEPADLETVSGTPNLETLPELPPVALEESQELGIDEPAVVEVASGTPNLETLPELPPIALEEPRELSVDELATVETPSDLQETVAVADVVVQEETIDEQVPKSSKDKKKAKKGKGKKGAQIEPEVSASATPIEPSTPVIEEAKIQSELPESAVIPPPDAQEPDTTNVEAESSPTSTQVKKITEEKAEEIIEPIQETVKPIDDSAAPTSKKEKKKKGKKGKSAEVVEPETAVEAAQPEQSIEEASRDIHVQEEPTPELEQLSEPVVSEPVIEEASKDETPLPEPSVEDESALPGNSSKKDKKKKSKKGKFVDLADIATPSDTDPSTPIIEEAAKDLVLENVPQPEESSEPIPSQPLTEDLPKVDSLPEEIVEPLIPAVEEEPATPTTPSKKEKKKKGKKRTSISVPGSEPLVESVPATPIIEEAKTEIQELPKPILSEPLTQNLTVDVALPEATVERSEPAVEDEPVTPSSAKKDKKKKGKKGTLTSVPEPEPVESIPPTPIIEEATIEQQLPEPIASDPSTEEPTVDVALPEATVERSEPAVEDEPVTPSSDKKDKKKKGKKDKSIDITETEPSTPVIEEVTIEKAQLPEPIPSEPLTEEPTVDVALPEATVERSEPTVEDEPVTPSSAKKDKKKKGKKGKSIDITNTELSTSSTPYPSTPVVEEAPILQESAIEQLPEPTVPEPTIEEPTKNIQPPAEPLESIGPVVDEEPVTPSSKKTKKKGKKNKSIDVTEAESSQPLTPSEPAPQEPVVEEPSTTVERSAEIEQSFEFNQPQPVTEDSSLPVEVPEQVIDEVVPTPTSSSKENKEKEKKGASMDLTETEPHVPTEPVQSEPLVPEIVTEDPTLIVEELAVVEQLPEPTVTEPTAEHISTPTIPLLETVDEEPLPTSAKKDKKKKGKKGKSIDVTETEPSTPTEPVQSEIPIPTEPIPSESNQSEHTLPEQVVQDVSTPTTSSREAAEDDLAIPTSAKKDKKKKGKKNKISEDIEVEQLATPVEVETVSSEFVKEEPNLSAPANTEPIVPESIPSEPVQSDFIEPERIPKDTSAEGISFQEAAEPSTPIVEDAPSSSKKDKKKKGKKGKSIETTDTTGPVQIESTQPEAVLPEPILEETAQPGLIQAEPVIDDVSTPATALAEIIDRALPTKDEVSALSPKKDKKKKGKKDKSETDISTPTETLSSTPVVSGVDEDLVVSSTPLASEPLPHNDPPVNESQPVESEPTSELAPENIGVQDFAAPLFKEDKKAAQDDELTSIIEPEPSKEVEPVTEVKNKTPTIVESPLDIQEEIPVMKTTDPSTEEPAPVIEDEMATLMSKKDKKKKGKGKKSDSATLGSEIGQDQIPIETVQPEPTTLAGEKSDDLPVVEVQEPALEKTDDLPMEQDRDLPVEKIDELPTEQPLAPAVEEEAATPVSKKNKKKGKKGSISEPAHFVDLERSVDNVAKIDDLPTEQVKEPVVEEEMPSPVSKKDKKKKGKGKANALETDTTPSTPTLEGPGTPKLEQESVLAAPQASEPISADHGLPEPTPLVENQSLTEDQIAASVEPIVIEQPLSGAQTDSYFPASEPKQDVVDDSAPPSKKDKKKGKKGKKAALQESEPSTPIETPIEAWKDLVLDDVPFETPTEEKKEPVLEGMPITVPVEKEIASDLTVSIPEKSDESTEVPVPEEVVPPMSAKEKKKKKKGKKGAVIESEPSTPFETPLEEPKEFVVEDDMPFETPLEVPRELVLDDLPFETPLETQKELNMEDTPFETPLETPLEVPRELVLDDLPIQTPLEVQKELVLGDLPVSTSEMPEASENVPVQEAVVEEISTSVKDKKKLKKAKSSSMLASEPETPLEIPAEEKQELVLDNLPVTAPVEEHKEIAVDNVPISVPDLPEMPKDLPAEQALAIDVAPLSAKDKKKAKKGKRVSLSISEPATPLETPAEEKKDFIAEDLPITLPEVVEAPKDVPAQEEVVEEPAPVLAKDKKKTKKGKKAALLESEPSTPTTTETPVEELKQVALDELPISASELPEGTKDVQLQEDAVDDAQVAEVDTPMSAKDKKKAKKGKRASTIETGPSTPIETPVEELKEAAIDDQLVSKPETPEVPKAESATPTAQPEETPTADELGSTSAKEKKTSKKGKKASSADSEPLTPLEPSTPMVKPIEIPVEKPKEMSVEGPEEIIKDQQLIAKPEVPAGVDDLGPILKKDKKKGKKAKKGSVMEEEPSQATTPVDPIKELSSDNPLSVVDTLTQLKDEPKQLPESSTSESQDQSTDITPIIASETPAEVTEYPVPPQEDDSILNNKKDKKKAKKGKRASMIEDELTQPTETPVEGFKVTPIEGLVVPVPDISDKVKDEPVLEPISGPEILIAAKDEPVLGQEDSLATVGKKNKKKAKKSKKGEVSEPSTPSGDVKIDEVFGNSAQVRQLEDKEDSAHIMSFAEGNMSPNVVAPEVQLGPLLEEANITKPSLVEENAFEIIEHPATLQEPQEPKVDEWDVPSAKKEKKSQSAVEETTSEALTTVPEIKTLPGSSSTTTTLTEPLAEPQIPEEPSALLLGNAAPHAVEESTRDTIDDLTATPIIQPEEAPAAEDRGVPSLSKKSKKGKKGKKDKQPTFEEPTQGSTIPDSSISDVLATEENSNKIADDVPVAATTRLEEAVHDNWDAPTSSKTEKSKEDNRASTSEHSVQDSSIPIMFPETTMDKTPLEDASAILIDEPAQGVEPKILSKELELPQFEEQMPISSFTDEKHSLDEVERFDTPTGEPENPLADELVSSSPTKTDKKRGDKAKGKQSSTTIPVPETVLESQTQNNKSVPTEVEDVQPKPSKEDIPEPPVEDVVLNLAQVEQFQSTPTPTEPADGWALPTPTKGKKKGKKAKGAASGTAMPISEILSEILPKSDVNETAFLPNVDAQRAPTQEITPEILPERGIQGPILPSTEVTQPMPHSIESAVEDWDLPNATIDNEKGNEEQLETVVPVSEEISKVQPDIVLPEVQTNSLLAVESRESNVLPPVIKPSLEDETRSLDEPSPSEAGATLSKPGREDKVQPKITPSVDQEGPAVDEEVLPTTPSKKKSKKGKKSVAAMPASDIITDKVVDDISQTRQADLTQETSESLVTTLPTEQEPSVENESTIPSSSKPSKQGKGRKSGTATLISEVIPNRLADISPPLQGLEPELRGHNDLQPTISKGTSLEQEPAGKDDWVGDMSKKKSKKDKVQQSESATTNSELVSHEQLQPFEGKARAVDDVEPIITSVAEQELQVKDESAALPSKKKGKNKGEQPGTATPIAETFNVDPPQQNEDDFTHAIEPELASLLPAAEQEASVEDEWASKKKGKKGKGKKSEPESPILDIAPIVEPTSTPEPSSTIDNAPILESADFVVESSQPAIEESVQMPLAQPESVPDVVPTENVSQVVEAELSRDADVIERPSPSRKLSKKDKKAKKKPVAFSPDDELVPETEVPTEVKSLEPLPTTEPVEVKGTPIVEVAPVPSTEVLEGELPSLKPTLQAQEEQVAALRSDAWPIDEQPKDISQEDDWASSAPQKSKKGKKEKKAMNVPAFDDVKPTLTLAPEEQSLKAENPTHTKDDREIKQSLDIAHEPLETRPESIETNTEPALTTSHTNITIEQPEISIPQDEISIEPQRVEETPVEAEVDESGTPLTKKASKKGKKGKKPKGESSKSVNLSEEASTSGNAGVEQPLELSVPNEPVLAIIPETTTIEEMPKDEPEDVSGAPITKSKKDRKGKKSKPTSEAATSTVKKEVAVFEEPALGAKEFDTRNPEVVTIEAPQSIIVEDQTPLTAIQQDQLETQTPIVKEAEPIPGNSLQDIPIVTNSSEVQVQQPAKDDIANFTLPSSLFKKKGKNDMKAKKGRKDADEKMVDEIQTTDTNIIEPELVVDTSPTPFQETEAHSEHFVSPRRSSALESVTVLEPASNAVYDQPTETIREPPVTEQTNQQEHFETAPLPLSLDALHDEVADLKQRSEALNQSFEDDEKLEERSLEEPSASQLTSMSEMTSKLGKKDKKSSKKSKGAAVDWSAPTTPVFEPAAQSEAHIEPKDNLPEFIVEADLKIPSPELSKTDKERDQTSTVSWEEPSKSPTPIPEPSTISETREPTQELIEQTIPEPVHAPTQNPVEEPSRELTQEAEPVQIDIPPRKPNKKNKKAAKIAVSNWEGSSEPTTPATEPTTILESPKLIQTPVLEALELAPSETPYLAEQPRVLPESREVDKNIIDSASNDLEVLNQEPAAVAVAITEPVVGETPVLSHKLSQKDKKKAKQTTWDDTTIKAMLPAPILEIPVVVEDEVAPLPTMEEEVVVENEKPTMFRKLSKKEKQKAKAAATTRDEHTEPSMGSLPLADTQPPPVEQQPALSHLQETLQQQEIVVAESRDIIMAENATARLNQHLSRRKSRSRYNQSSLHQATFKTFHRKRKSVFLSPLKMA
jgi:hypothetical protein